MADVIEQPDQPVSIDEVPGVLRSRPEVLDAAVLRTQSGNVSTVMVVPQGFVHGPRLRNLVAELSTEDPVRIRVAIVQEIPRLAGGAMDHAAARDVLSGGAFVYDYETPTTEVERAIAGMLRNGLAIGRVSATDDFVSLGGDSLVALELEDFLQARFGVEVDPEALFGADSIRAMAAIVEGARRSDHVDRPG